MNTDQLSAEAWEEMLKTTLRKVPCITIDGSGTAIIKSAIEKATVELREQLRLADAAAQARNHLESRAAHASEQVVKCKCGRENRSDNTNCYHCGERLCHTPISHAAHASEQERWTVRYPSEGALETDLVFNDGSAIRINAPLARIIAHAHNATLQRRQNDA